jgi:carboxypeptidase family protein
MIHRFSQRAGVVLGGAALVVSGIVAPAYAGARSAGATLVVRAVDAATGAPVSGFCATLSPIDGSGCGDGPEVILEALTAGPAQVFVSPGETSNYLSSADVAVTLVDGETTSVTVPLTLGGRVAATVIDRTTGQGVADACIVLVVPRRGGLPDGCGNVTDQLGRVTSYPLAAGTYHMFVFTPEGYGYQWAGPRRGTGDQREAARIRVRAGQVTQAPTVRLDPAGEISGVVSDPAGAPVPGADVSISAWGFGVGPSLNTVTDEQGRYVLDHLGPYSWPLSFTPGGNLPRQWSGGVGNRFQAETIRVRPAQTTSYDMTLARGSVLRGAVTVRGGAVADSWRLVAANATTGDQMGVADSAEAGDLTYQMPLVGPQQVKIRWDAQIGEEDRSGWWENAADITTATRVPVPRSGVRTLDLTIG